ncbi:MAG TPA: glycogen synthase GlgA [Candidatus Ornithomonoglobus intestinigallinarum]|uniref:Glycogen synthase n=1 Tax=Candidatus Ornithomonoglobus intestinigallinarum TaxID=2840894 RepID=A0A9D1H193_9FIRM|nr:glycogen synthase GlgA [Candidatus Ornithomonoglobus intestinigallinarum]
MDLKGEDRVMKVLFATPEAAPFVKTGGLGDVAGSLPAALREKGVDARVILPLYRCIPQQYKDQMKYIDHIYIDMAWRRQYAGIFELEYGGCIYYFIDNEFYFNGDTPYSYIHLDCEKFIFFSKAVLSLLPTIDFRPDVINCNDWQTGPIPVFLDTFQDNPFFRGIKTVMTIHNLKFQGRWDFKGIKDAMGISDYYFTPDKLEYYKDANLLKGGMVYANKISTVSETYAWEITTPEYGEGLDRLLDARRNDLVGIVNGISYTDWNPQTDPMIYQKYTAKNVHKKKTENKRRLQADLGLPVDDGRMMIGVVSRLTDQKGFDLVAYKLEELCSGGGAQVVVLGTGDEKYENLFKHYAWKYPNNFSAQIYFSNEMSHKIYAASDAFLMPSRFEPCGLSQLISMRYGTVPIVRETGGLKDTVWPYNEYTGEGTGFSFANYNADEMLGIIYYAMDIFYNRKDEWNKIVDNGMAADYSWNVSADKYIRMYQDLTGIYDLPEKKTKPAAAKVKKDDTAEEYEKLKADADKSAEEIAKKADPGVIKVENPFDDEKTAAKKPAAKRTRKTTAKSAGEKKPAAKKTTAGKTAKAADNAKTEAKTPAKKPAARRTAGKKSTEEK